MTSFFDLAAQQAVIKTQIDKNIANVLAHGKYILGPEVVELEERLCEYTGAKYCISCANGTDALQIALMAIGIGPGDEVITPAFSYISSAEATVLLGANPVYVDVDPVTFNINTSLIEEKLLKNTKAIIPVSLYGQTAQMDAINSIAAQNNLFVIEDATPEFGGEFKGNKSCNLSQIACTSFFPTKPLGCYGDGGAIFTSDKSLAKIIRQIARHGQENRYNHVRVGINSRLDTLQAAVLLAKLDILDLEIEARAKLASEYTKAFSRLEGINTPLIADKNKSAWAQYTLSCENREKLQVELNLLGIPTAVYYPKPLPQQPALVSSQFGFGTSEKLSQTVLSLPFHAYMKEADFELITCSIIKNHKFK